MPLLDTWIMHLLLVDYTTRQFVQRLGTRYQLLYLALGTWPRSAGCRDSAKILGQSRGIKNNCGVWQSWANLSLAGLEHCTITGMPRNNANFLCLHLRNRIELLYISFYIFIALQNCQLEAYTLEWMMETRTCVHKLSWNCKLWGCNSKKVTSLIYSCTESAGVWDTFLDVWGSALICDWWGASFPFGVSEQKVIYHSGHDDPPCRVEVQCQKENRQDVWL